MSVPVPYSVQPGDKLRVTKDKPYGSDLMTGDLVTAMDVGIKVVGRVPVPVVILSTAYGPQQLPFSVLEPVIDLPSYTPAEPDDVVDAFFSKMLTEVLTEDDDLRGVFIEATQQLAANDEKSVQEPQGGGTSVQEAPTQRTVGQVWSFADQEGDELDVTYYEKDCPNHGREGGFHIGINGEEEVVIPAGAIDHLIRFLFHYKKFSERPETE